MPLRACDALKLRGHELDQIAATAGISPLVVIPGQHFHATIAETTLVVPGIDDGRVRIALKSAETSSSSVYAKNILHRAFAADFSAPLTVATVAGLSTKTVRSTTLTFGVGRASRIRPACLLAPDDQVSAFWPRRSNSESC